MASPWYTADGRREVTPVSLSGRPAFKVRNPQHHTQTPDEAGIVYARYIERSGQRILAPVTLKQLSDLGVNAVELGTERPANAYPTQDTEAPRIIRVPGESAADWNTRKYAEGIGRLLGDIANARRAA